MKMDKEETEYMLRWSEHNPQVMAIFHQVGNISKQRKYTLTKTLLSHYLFTLDVGGGPAD